VLIGASALVFLLAPGLTKVTIRTDGLALVPAHAPEIETDRNIRERFGVTDKIVVVVETSNPRGIYNAQTLRRIVELTTTLERLPGVGPGHVASLATESSDHVAPSALTFRRWLDPLPATGEELDALRRDLSDAGVYTGTLISSDPVTSAAAILVDVGRDFERGALYRRIRDAVQIEGAAGDRVLVVGAPVAESQLGDHLLADLATLIPISGLVLVVVFYASFRSWPLVLLPMAEVAASLVFTFSLMGWLGVPVYLTVAVLPVILTMIGVTDDLHIFTHLLPRLRPGTPEPQPRAVTETMDEMAAPVSKASLTTAVGFLSFTASSIVPVSVFGFFMAIGVLFSALWSLTVMPAALALIPAGRLRRRPVSPLATAAAGPGRLEALGRGVVRWRAPILGAVVLLLVVAPFGVLRVRVQDSWIEGFSAGSDFRRATAEVDRLFGGTHILRIALDGRAVETSGQIRSDAVGEATVLLPGRVVEPPSLLEHHKLTLSSVADDGSRGSPPLRVDARIAHAQSFAGGTRVQVLLGRRPSLRRSLGKYAGLLDYTINADGRLLQPSLLERIGDFERFLAEQRTEGVGRVMGPHEHLATMHYMLHARREGERRIPDDPDRVTQLAVYYRLIRGDKSLHEIFDPSFRQALITVLLKHANFADTARLMSAVRDYERQNLAPYGIAVRFAGDVAASQAMIEAIVGTQVSSVLLSLIGIGALTCVLFGSLVWGLLCVLPAALGVLGVFAAMGWTGMPLGVATSMFAATVLCIGDDYAIHLLEAVRRLLREGRAVEDAVVQAIVVTAPAILLDGLAVGAAFGVLCLSRVPPNARLGGLVVVSILVCLVVTLGVLPAFVVWAPSKLLQSAAGSSSASGDRAGEGLQ
jgi:hypothetical protein